MAECFDQELKAWRGSLFAGANYGAENALPSCARPGAIAAPDLAVHHRRPKGLLAAVVGGVEQEPEPVGGMLQQMPGQTTIRFVREAAFGQSLQFTSQAQAALGQSIAAQPMAAPRASQGIRAIDQPQHRPRQAHRAAHGGFQQKLAPRRPANTRCAAEMKFAKGRMRTK
jgi:hypothetical protein